MPRKTKRLVQSFLDEQMQILHAKGESVSIRMRTIFEAVREVKGDQEKDTNTAQDEWDIHEPLATVNTESERNSKGEYPLILHVAAFVGNSWLTEICITSELDVNQVNKHGWTALMVANVLGHHKCAQLLSERAATLTPPNPEPQAFPPSAMVSIAGEVWVGTFQCDDGFKRYFRTNHPIPPFITRFYFEISFVTMRLQE